MQSLKKLILIVLSPVRLQVCGTGPGICSGRAYPSEGYPKGKWQGGHPQLFSVVLHTWTHQGESVSLDCQHVLNVLETSSEEGKGEEAECRCPRSSLFVYRRGSTNTNYHLNVFDDRGKF